MRVFKKLALGVLVAVALWAAGFCVFTLSSVMAQQQGKDETTDAIVVFTGGSDRIQEGLDLFARGRSSHLFISGVFADVKKREILALWKGEHALPPCCVSLGYEATSTTQNAQETREWMIENNYSSLRLVTANFHMWRSLMELKHALPGIQIYAHPVRQTDHPAGSRHFWELIFSEYHKTLYRAVQLLFTWRKPLPESE